MRAAAKAMGTTSLARHVGLSHRQLYHAMRTAGLVPVEPYKRAGADAMVFSAEDVRRIEVAAALMRAIPADSTNRRPLGDIIRALFASPMPPEEGWVILDTGPHGLEVRYLASDELVLSLGDPWTGGVVAPLPEMWPLEEEEPWPGS